MAQEDIHVGGDLLEVVSAEHSIDELELVHVPQ